MDANCVLTFGTEGGRSVSIRIPKADPDMTQAAARNAMDQILGAAAIQTSSGLINSRVKAILEKVSTISYDVKS